VETTCLTIRFPRPHFRQVAPRRYTRRFTYLFLKCALYKGLKLWKMIVQE